MKSNFVNPGLSGLSDQYASAAKELATMLVHDAKAQNKRFYGKLVELINVMYGARRHEITVRRIKPYLNHFSGGKPSTNSVLDDLIARFPTMFGQPANTAPAAPPGATGEKETAPAKSSTGKYLTYGLVAAAIGGAAFFFMPDDENKNKS